MTRSLELGQKYFRHGLIAEKKSSLKMSIQNLRIRMEESAKVLMKEKFSQSSL